MSADTMVLCQAINLTSWDEKGVRQFEQNLVDAGSLLKHFNIYGCIGMSDVLCRDDENSTPQSVHYLRLDWPEMRLIIGKDVSELMIPIRWPTAVEDTEWEKFVELLRALYKGFSTREVFIGPDYSGLMNLGFKEITSGGSYESVASRLRAAPEIRAAVFS